MAVGSHRFLITGVQLLKFPFLLGVSSRAETGNLSCPHPISSLEAVLDGSKNLWN